MTIELTILTRLNDAEDRAGQSLVSFLPFERQSDSFLVTGHWLDENAEDCVVAEHVKVSDIATSVGNPLLDAVQRIERKLLPSRLMADQA